MNKTVKLAFLVFMVLGIAFSIFNFVAADLQAQAPACGWVKLHPAIPDCYGLGNSCYDFTGC